MIVNRKDIFMTGFKSKLGFSFTRKDMEEFETIIDFYEKENARLKDKNNKAFELLQILHYNFSDYDDMHERIEDIQKILKEN